jgi:formamidopyrimidine-DNA glycosylase
MSGKILLKETQKPELKHTHAIFAWEKQGAIPLFLHFVDTRRFGIIDAFVGKDWREHSLLQEIGIEPLECEDLGKHLFEISQGKRCSVKSFIMDQRVVAGVGNIYACEALFKAGLHPERMCSLVGKKEYEKLADEIKAILSEAIRAGGTTFRDYRNAEGKSGGFSVKLSVYDREGEPCLRCEGVKVVSVRIVGRSSYFCPSCQN